MLLEFRVRNFRSFRDETVFSMVASTDKEMLETNTAETGVKAAPAVADVGVANSTSFVAVAALR